MKKTEQAAEPLFRVEVLVSIAALLLGSVIYLAGRPASIFALSDLNQFATWTSALPSGLHTLGFGLLLAMTAPTRRLGLVFASTWGLTEAVFEFIQHPVVTVMPGLIGSYQRASTFDPADLIAIAVATVVAIALLTGDKQR